MKVLMLTTSYPDSLNKNSGKFVRSLVQALEKNNFDVEVLCPSGYTALTGGSGILPNLKISFKAKLQFPIYLLHTFFLISIRARDSDIIHANWGLTAFLALLSKPIHRKKIILTARSSQLLFTKNKMFKIFLGFTYKNVDRLVVLSRSSKNYLENEYGIHGAAVIRNGVDVSGINSGVDGLVKYKKFKKFITVGRLTSLKGINYLVKGFSNVKNKNSLLIIVGSGEEEMNLKRLVRDLGIENRVIFLGNVDTKTVYNYMAVSDMFVFSSLMETGGNVLLEAAALGLPIITTRVGWAEEIVKDGVNGLFIEKKESKEITNKLDIILSDIKMFRKFKNNANKLAKSNIFSWGYCASLYRKEYKNLLYGSSMENKSWMHNKSLDIRFKKIVKLCNFKRGMKVLDVGCRDMQLKSYLPNYVNYAAADINTKKGIVKVDLNNGKLPFEDETFDYVFCLEVLEHIHSPFKVLSELKRVSKKYVIISVPNPYHYRDAVKHLLRMPDKQGHINSFIYSNIWRQCKDLNIKILKIKGSFSLPFLHSNSFLLSRHLVYLLEV